MKVIFLSTFDYPLGDAGSLRYSFLSKLFVKNGFDPYFIGKGNISKNCYSRSNYGFFTSLKCKRRNIIAKAIDTVFWFEHKMVHEFKKIANPNDIVVICCFFSKKTNKRIINYANNNNIKVIFAIEEKYSKNEFNAFDVISLIGYKKCESFYKNICYYKKPIIAISSYLGAFAEKANVPFIVLPFLYDEDLEIPSAEQRKNDKIVFFYAGTPGKKDLLFDMLDGFGHLDFLQQQRIEVNIFGIDNEYAKRWLPRNTYSSISSFTTFFGKVDHKTIEREIVNSDFSILLRDSNEEFAKAGFPTKVAESLFCGIPVITNLTSDLEYYLSDGHNSIIVKGNDSVAFRNAIIRACNVSAKELSTMKKNARFTSLKQLTTASFEQQFKDFIKLINI